MHAIGASGQTPQSTGDPGPHAETGSGPFTFGLEYPMMGVRGKTATVRHDKPVRVMEAQAFAAECLEILDEVYEHDIEVLITRNGKPIARFIRFEPRPSDLKPKSTRKK